MKMGDWVIDKFGEIGQVHQRKPYERTPDAIYIKWVNGNPSWIERNKITPLTKEVADIMREV